MLLRLFFLLFLAMQAAFAAAPQTMPREGRAFSLRLAGALERRGRGEPRNAEPRDLIVAIRLESGGTARLESLTGTTQEQVACTGTLTAPKVVAGRLRCHLAVRAPDGAGRLATGDFDLSIDVQGAAPAGTFSGLFAGLPSRGVAEAIRIHDFVDSDSPRGVRLWVPQKLAEVRGIVVWGNGSAMDDRASAFRGDLQAFCASVGFALAATSQFGNDMSGVDGDVFAEAMKQLAADSGLPELERAPLVMTGVSNGGNMAYAMNAAHPERVIAFSTWKGGEYRTVKSVPEEARKTPAILVLGETDLPWRLKALDEQWNEHRPKGAHWARATEHEAGHTPGSVIHMLLPFFADAIEARLPRDASARKGPVALRAVDEKAAFLGEPGDGAVGVTKITRKSDFAGDEKTASWLLNEKVAVVYRGFSSHGNPLKLEVNRSPATSVCQVLRPDRPLAIRLLATNSTKWDALDIYDGAVKVGSVAGPGKTLTLAPPIAAGVHAFTAVGKAAGSGEIRVATPVTVIVTP